MRLSDPFEIDKIDKALNEFNTQNNVVSDRLDFFIKDCDVYTNMLVQLDREGVDEALPAEIQKTLEPIKEKCQLITYQLICLLNDQNLAQFMEKKKQLK